MPITKKEMADLIATTEKLCEVRKPPPGCDRGTMINQNLPRSICSIGHRVDTELPPGTIEVWQDGRCIGRIENIGLI